MRVAHGGGRHEHLREEPGKTRDDKTRGKKRGRGPKGSNTLYTPSPTPSPNARATHTHLLDPTAVRDDKDPPHPPMPHTLQPSLVLLSFSRVLSSSPSLLVPPPLSFFPSSRHAAATCSLAALRTHALATHLAPTCPLPTHYVHRVSVRADHRNLRRFARQQRQGVRQGAGAGGAVCVRARVRAYVRACVSVRMCVCGHALVCACF